MPDGERIADATLSSDGRIFAWVLGHAEEPVRIYDPLTNQWTLDEPESLPGPIPFDGQPAGRWGYGDETEVAAAGDGRMYMSVGVSGPDFHLVGYDPGSRRWEPEVALTFGDFVFDMASGSDGLIYLLSNDAILAFDPHDGSLSRGVPGAATADVIFSAGDLEFAAFSTFAGLMQEVRLYDARADAWSPARELPALGGQVVGQWAADVDGWMYGVQLSPPGAVAVHPNAGEVIELPAPPLAVNAVDIVVSGRTVYLLASGEPVVWFERPAD